MNLSNELRSIIKSGGAITQLIAINLAVFLIVNIANVFLYLFNSQYISDKIIRFLAIPADTSNLATHIWTMFTYMFLHEGFLHILFNMLWLYWFGIIFMRYFTQRQMVGLYIMGGLLGAIVYVLSFNLFPAFEQQKIYSYALGASASVIAIVIATAVYIPNYIVHVILIGPIKLKWIALVMLVLDIIGIASENSGGHLAHLGGAIMGWWFIAAYRNKIDLTSWTKRFTGLSLKKFTGKNPHLNVSYKRDEPEYEHKKRKNQQTIDAILDKISKNGYDSLTAQEKETLFTYSKRKDL